MNHKADAGRIDIRNRQAKSSIVVVCEHASAHIPEQFGDLGLTVDALQSHIAWDPGAMALALRMAKTLDAVLVASKTSRLVYDCNRPPEAPDAMPSRSEAFDVPGNASLDASRKAARVTDYYEPFRAAVSDVIRKRSDPVLVTVHSFTPIFLGQRREVEIGVLHDVDARLADALVSIAARTVPYIVRRNEPYGPEDGVTHTLKEHALPGGHLNVMLEIRSDLISDAAAQDKMAAALSGLISQALLELGVAA